MSFQHPGILWGLLAIAIPIIIHLFNFRRIRKVYFPNLSFLKEITEKNRRRAELRHVLILLSRILAIAAVVMAFAGPYLPRGNGGPDLSGDRVVSVYLDNSFSMQAGNEFEANFNEAKARIRKVTEALPPATRYQLITNDLEPGSGLLISRDDLLRNINDKAVSSGSRQITSMMARMRDQVPPKNRDDAVYVVVSDFQSVQDDKPADELVDSGGQYLFVPVSSRTSIPNLYIDSAWLAAPVRQAGTANQAGARIVNATNEDLEKVSIRFFINGVQQSATAIDMPAGDQVDVGLPFTIRSRGVFHARLEISDYPVTFDDTWFLSWFAEGKVDLLHIHPKQNATDFIPRLFANDSVFNITSQPSGSVDFSRFGSYNMFILDGLSELSPGMAQQLDNALELGASILVFPEPRGRNDELNQWLSLHSCAYQALDTMASRVSWLNLEHGLLRDVYERPPGRIDLPVVRRSFPFTARSRPGMSEVLRYRADLPFLSDIPDGRGHIYLSAVPLDESFSNYPAHSLFVYLTLNMALQAGGQTDVSHTVGTLDPVSIGRIEVPADKSIVMNQEGVDNELIPELIRQEGEHFVRLHGALSDAGNYNLNLEDETVGGLAFNYNRSESVMNFPDAEGLREWLGSLTGISKAFILSEDELPLDASLRQMQDKRKLPFWFIVTALAFLLAEVLLLRFMK